MTSRPLRPHPLFVGLITVVVLAVGPVFAFEPAGSQLARTAVERCDAVADHPAATDAPAVAQALALAERAVDADGNDAVAHFAVFCALAKQSELRGFSLQNLFSLRRLHREIDTALRLAPDYGDALIAKGAFLLHLPRLLGGDAKEAEQLLRHAVDLEPERISARLYLAQAFDVSGRSADSAGQARVALDLALRAGRHEQAQEARSLLARLGR